MDKLSRHINADVPVNVRCFSAPVEYVNFDSCVITCWFTAFSDDLNSVLGANSPRTNKNISDCGLNVHG